MISFFLTDQSADFQNRLKEIFKRAPDEFMTSDFAATAKASILYHIRNISCIHLTLFYKYVVSVLRIINYLFCIFQSLLPADNTEITSREQIKTLIQVVAQLKFLAEGAIERKNNYGKDSDDLAGLLKTLNSLHIDRTYVANWSNMQKGFGIISQ